MKKIILASASPRRKELLEQINIPFEIRVSNAEEIITGHDPGTIVKELAYQKAAAVAGQCSGSEVILGADTVVAIENKILGKPKDEKDAADMLELLQGKTHQVYTGVSMICMDKKRPESETFYEKTDVTMYPMDKREIQEYIATGEPLDKAGAYGIQGAAAAFIKKINGDYNNVVGLPAARVYQMLKTMI